MPKSLFPLIPSYSFIQNMKLVFLDFDGVLNSHQFWFKSPPKDRGITMIDAEAVERLERLCFETQANIVISSTWRIIHKLPKLKEWLRKRGLKTPKILGVTPNLVNRKGRGDEIQRWLDVISVREELDIEGVVILDDDSDMLHLSPWHVKTSMSHGLLDSHVEKAKGIISLPAPAFGKTKSF
jgi:hypothetical protein